MGHYTDRAMTQTFHELTAGRLKTELEACVESVHGTPLKAIEQLAYTAGLLLGAADGIRWSYEWDRSDEELRAKENS